MSKPEESPREQTAMRRVLGNFGFLLRGRSVAAVMAFATTALMARSLGPAEFGMVVLIQTYALLVRGLLNFKQFQGIVRYGVSLHDANDTYALQRLISICQLIDRYASITSTVVAVIMAPFIGPLMGMGPDHVILLTLYSLVLLSTGNNAAIGILRLFDQFNILGRQMTIGPTIGFFGVALAWWFDSPITVFVAVMAFAYVSENIYLSWCGRREYRRRIERPARGERVNLASMDEFSGLRHFLWITYWQSNVDLVPKRVSIMMAGYLLGASEAGLLRLARQISSLLSGPAVLIRHVVFPDLTRSWNQGSADFKLVAYRTALIGGGAGLLFVLVGYFSGDILLAALFGEEFTGAAAVLTLMLLGGAFDIAAASLRSACYAIGHAGKVLRLHVQSSVIYLTLFIALTSQMGLIGAGWAACFAAALPPVAMALLIRKSTRKAKV
ncbi:MAG: lipopolysaccharide biosynthesis protein [Gammaproteobacteria bacterium]|nr:lipopolysaccharide biosynthesis protein [Gammaproteobacteria bacterium]